MSNNDPFIEYKDNDIFVYYVDHIFDHSCADCKLTAKTNPEQATQDKINQLVRESVYYKKPTPKEHSYSGDRSRTAIITWKNAPAYGFTYVRT